MIKRGVVLCMLLLVFGVVLVGAQVTSEDDRDISISGCSDSGVAVGIGGCLNNEFYCQSENNFLDVFKVPDACASFKDSPKLSDICCPLEEFICDTGEQNPVCAPRTKDCSFYTNNITCAAKQCYWNKKLDTNDDGECNGAEECDELCVPYSYGCYGYTDPDDCDKDPQNVSQNDPNCKYGEYVSGGAAYVVSQETCKCVWDEADEGGTDTCGLQYNVTSVYGDGSKFSVCNFILKIGEEGCKDGFEKYSYVATYEDNTLPNILSGDVACGNRSGTRRCGEAIVKVPFFDFVNFLVVVVILFGVYAFRNKIFVGGEK